ncbi:MAG TPA: isoprenylcysteine carboxylmethyltransferase family protein [Candidatus Dormibacteraeota bacterium]
MTVTTPAITGDLPAEGAAPRRRPRRSLADPEYLAELRYLAFGRAVPTALFGFLGWLQLQHLLAALPITGAGHAAETVLPRALYLMFCCLPAAIYLTRPRPRASDGRVMARVAAFGGTLILLLLPVFTPDSPALLTVPGWVGTASGLLLAAAWMFALWGLAYLRRSLSVIPEARRLTTGGPYRLVRHPLYFAEITAAFALQLTNLRVLPLLALGAFVALQLSRARFEERLLSANFPEYAAYAAHTPRIIPLVV